MPRRPRVCPAQQAITHAGTAPLKACRMLDLCGTHPKVCNPGSTVKNIRHIKSRGMLQIILPILFTSIFMKNMKIF